jgi:hypothetical protein
MMDYLNRDENTKFGRSAEWNLNRLILIAAVLCFAAILISDNPLIPLIIMTLANAIFYSFTVPAMCRDNAVLEVAVNRLADRVESLEMDKKVEALKKVDAS